MRVTARRKVVVTQLRVVLVALLTHFVRTLRNLFLQLRLSLGRQMRATLVSPTRSLQFLGVIASRSRAHPV